MTNTKHGSSITTLVQESPKGMVTIEIFLVLFKYSVSENRIITKFSFQISMYTTIPFGEGRVNGGQT